MILLRVGDVIPLSLMLYAGDNDKVVKCKLTSFYPRTTIVSSVLLPFRADGLYDNFDYTMPDVDLVTAYFDVFESDGVTPSAYRRSEEIFAIEKTSPQYTCRMSTSFNPVSGAQEMLTWIEKDGILVEDPESCTVTVYNADGDEMWTDTTTDITSEGVFQFDHEAAIFSSDSNYYVIIDIDVNSVTKRTLQPFITMG